MAYYNKEQIRIFAKQKNEEINSVGFIPLTPIEQTESQLDKEEEVVGFFWFDVDENAEPGKKIKLQGKTYVRIDLNLYTDDRFAIDLYQSQKDSKTVSEVIKQRKKEQENAIGTDIDKAKLEEAFIKKLKK
jgi:hypothetical protein